MTQLRYRTLTNIGLGYDAPTPQNDPLKELCARIYKGEVVPILSNNLYNELIFAPLLASRANDPVTGNGSDYTASQVENGNTPNQDISKPEPTVNEQLAILWANHIGYPMRDKMVLARVAQYKRIYSVDEEQAKSEFLTFVKDVVKGVVKEVLPDRLNNIPNLDARIRNWTVSELINALDLLKPDGPNDSPNMLRQLARMNLPLYVTTSYYDYLEQAIISEGRSTVRSQRSGAELQWADSKWAELQAEKQSVSQPPTPEKPVVFHLHGTDDVPKSLMLSEDDYLAFLWKVTQPMNDVNDEHAFLPPYLRECLADRTLLLLGYRLQDWDFLTLFHGLIKPIEPARRSFSVAIQLAGEQHDALEPERAKEYLQKYFQPTKINVLWSDSKEFVSKLWSEWDDHRRGE